MSEKDYKLSEREVKIGGTIYVVKSYCSLSKNEIKAKIARLIKTAATNV